MAHLALALLEQEARRMGERGDHLRLALHVLRPYVSTRDLVTLWGVLENLNASQRAHTLRRLLGVVRAQVGRRC